MEQQNSTQIAFVTDDGTTISSHFGRARFYEVVTFAGGVLAGRERREKAGHHSSGQHDGHGHGQHEANHGMMIAPIAGCSLLVARGMGMGAHTFLSAAGITPVLTDLHTIDEALTAFSTGTLTDNPRRLHDHGQGHDADHTH